MNSVRNSVCNGVTHSVRNGERRCVQNQNQNQSSITASWGVSIQACIRRQRSEQRTARVVACAFGGEF